MEFVAEEAGELAERYGFFADGEPGDALAVYADAVADVAGFPVRVEGGMELAINDQHGAGLTCFAAFVFRFGNGVILRRIDVMVPMSIHPKYAVGKEMEIS